MKNTNKQTIINELEDLEYERGLLDNFRTIVITTSIPRDIQNKFKGEIDKEIEIYEEQINQISNDLPLIN